LQYKIKRVLIAYDRDEAGNKAAGELAKKLERAGIDPYRLHFPKGMDANQYALEVTPAAHSLGIVIRSAEWLGSGAPPQTPTTVVADVDMAEEKPEPAAVEAPSSLAADPSPVLPASAVPPT